MSIVLEQLTKRYEGYPVVNNVSLEVADGEFFVLLGPSGSGKSTILRMIAGLAGIDAGRVVLHGRDVTLQPPQQRGAGFVFQNYALFRHMSVAENVEFGLRIRKVAAAARRRKRDELLELVGLSGLGARMPRQLSGGQQQRVALARALIVEPETLLLDEPLSNLDANLREEMRFEIRRLHDEYRYTTVYVTHDQSEAMTTADLIAVMNAGKIDQLGSPEDIYARPESEFVARFIGASNVIKGTACDSNHVDFAGATLKVVGAPLTANQSAVVAIRQHDIGLSTQAPVSPENAVKAVVTRQVYLGVARDYMVEAADGTALRVTTPTETNIAKGSDVWLTLPPDRCRALSR